MMVWAIRVEDSFQEHRVIIIRLTKKKSLYILSKAFSFGWASFSGVLKTKD